MTKSSGPALRQGLHSGQRQSPRSFLGASEMEAKAARAPEKKQEHLLFPLIIGQSVGLGARFGGQVASPTVGRVKSRTRGGVANVAPAGWKSRKEETN